MARFIRVVYSDPARERARRDGIVAGYQRLAAQETDPAWRAYFLDRAACYRRDGRVEVLREPPPWPRVALLRQQRPHGRGGSVDPRRPGPAARAPSGIEF
jgi:hypothetical protein